MQDKTLQYKPPLLKFLILGITSVWFIVSSTVSLNNMNAVNVSFKKDNN